MLSNDFTHPSNLKFFNGYSNYRTVAIPSSKKCSKWKKMNIGQTNLLPNTGNSRLRRSRGFSKAKSSNTSEIKKTLVSTLWSVGIDR